MIDYFTIAAFALVALGAGLAGYLAGRAAREAQLACLAQLLEEAP